jgi:hypothetical protein
MMADPFRSSGWSITTPGLLAGDRPGRLQERGIISPEQSTKPAADFTDFPTLDAIYGCK